MSQFIKLDPYQLEILNANVFIHFDRKRMQIDFNQLISNYIEQHLSNIRHIFHMFSSPNWEALLEDKLWNEILPALHTSNQPDNSFQAIVDAYNNTFNTFFTKEHLQNG
jgi:hypothetical protein